MGRLNHLQETLPKNLYGNQGFEGLEFVLLDYSSRDGLAGWIKARFMPEIKSGLLVYYRAEGYQRFFMAHAKNVAHRLARGEIVCNVDADNLTGWGFEDKDLLQRARLAGLRGHRIGNEFLDALPHSDSLRVRHGSEKDRWSSNGIHREIAQRNAAQECTVANRGRPWGVATVKRNFSTVLAT